MSRNHSWRSLPQTKICCTSSLIMSCIHEIIEPYMTYYILRLAGIEARLFSCSTNLREREYHRCNVFPSSFQPVITLARQLDQVDVEIRIPHMLTHMSFSIFFFRNASWVSSLTQKPPCHVVQIQLPDLRTLSFSLSFYLYEFSSTSLRSK